MLSQLLYLDVRKLNLVFNIPQFDPIDVSQFLPLALIAFWIVLKDQTFDCFEPSLLLVQLAVRLAELVLGPLQLRYASQWLLFVLTDPLGIRDPAVSRRIKLD